MNTNNLLQLKCLRFYSRCRGVGSIFSNLWKFIQSDISNYKCASIVSKELLETAEIVNGISIQKPIKSVLISSLTNVVDKIRNK